MRVFGDGFHGDAADLLQRLAPEHRTRAAEEGRVPQVVAVLNQTIEQIALVGHAAESAQISLKGIRREEVVRRLQHGATGVAQEPTHGRRQERAHRDMVAVEYGDELAVRDRQGVIEIARLGVCVVAANHVFGTATRGEFAKLWAAAVIEYVDPELVCRPIEVQRGEHRRLHDLQRFVVAGHEDVDRRPRRAIRRQRCGFAPQRPGVLYIAQHHDDPGVALGGQQAGAEKLLKPGVQIHRLREAPPDIARRGDDGEHDHDDSGTIAGQLPHEQSQQPHRSHQHALLSHAKGRRCCEREQRQRHGAGGQTRAAVGFGMEQTQGG